MICKNCGYDVPQGKVCIYCGTPLKSDKKSQEETSVKPFNSIEEACVEFNKINKYNKPLILLNTIFIIALFGLIIFIYLFLMSDSFRQTLNMYGIGNYTEFLDKIRSVFICIASIFTIYIALKNVVANKQIFYFAEWMNQNNLDLRYLIVNQSFSGTYNKMLPMYLSQAITVLFNPSVKKYFHLGTVLSSVLIFICIYSISNWIENILTYTILLPNAEANEILKIVFLSSDALIFIVTVIAFCMCNIIIRKKIQSKSNEIMLNEIEF